MILGISAILGLGTWLVDGRPSGDPAIEAARTPLKPGEIRLEDLQELEGVVWVDARRAGEWRRDGLPGSIHLTTLSDTDLGTQLAENQEALFTADRLVIYCGDLNCGLSHDLAERLRTDYADLIGGEILVLHGGLVALREAGMLKGSNPD